MRRLPVALLAILLAGCVAPAATPDAAGATFSTTHVFEGAYDTAGPFSRVLHAGPHGILEPEVVELASAFDGVAIQFALVRPDLPEGSLAPVILVASPYFDVMTPERVKENPQRDEISWWTFDHYEAFAENFVPHGYAVAFLATRGTGDSGGCWTFFGPAERADVDQAITWLANEPWSNGNVGMIGLSFEATSQWMAASTGNPHLRTIVPVVSSATDIYEFHVWNGTPGAPAAYGPAFYGYGAGVETINALGGAYLADHVTDRSPERRAQGALCPEAWSAFAAVGAAQGGGGRTPEDFWAARDFRDAVAERYQGSILVANGFRDVNAMRATYPYVNALEARGVVVKHLHGLWGHGYPDARIFASDDPTHKRWDWSETLLRWFDRWLKLDATVDIGPGAQVQDSSGLWRSEPTWPPRDATPLALHLADAGALERASDTPAAERVLAPGESVRFETEALGADLLFAGLPTLHLGLTPTGAGGALRADLYVSAEGEETRVGFAVIDLRVADGGEQAKPVTPGEPLVARMQLSPMDVRAPAGSRLVLALAHLEHSAAPVRLALGGDASPLTLPTIARGPEAYFDPPPT